MRVALPLPLRRTFDYRVDDTMPLPTVGMRVLVPVRQRSLVGVVTAISVEPSVNLSKLRTVIQVIDKIPTIPATLLKILLWAAEYYHHPVGEVLHAAMPSALRQSRDLMPELPRVFRLTAAGQEALATVPMRARVQRQLLARCHLEHGLEESALREGIAHVHAPLRRLLAQGWITAESAYPLVRAARASAIDLSTDQQRAVDAMVAESVRFTPFLLHGVTGSGKTEVYLRAAAAVIARHRQVLVLVPEIALTPQFIARIENTVGGRLVVLHSQMSAGERHRAWWAASAGLADVVLGTRLAVLAPFKALGLVIVDEEHDLSYKQQDGFRYHARDVAVKRAQVAQVPVVLGSATPSLESIANVHRGRYQLLSLPERAGGAQMPRVRLLDLSTMPAAEGLSPPVVKALARRLDRGEQSILYVNRRGFAPVVGCSACGWQGRCGRCDAALTLHRRSGVLRCHHCGGVEPALDHCPQCQGGDVYHVGEGTQRIEEAVQRLFPEARVMRFDSDRIKGGEHMAADLQRVRDGAVDILVGTQLLSKGHDFPAVTLVCVLSADRGLYATDFRSSERLFQQLTQVSGRAGRAQRPGEVLIQTLYPTLPTYAYLTRHDFDGFASAALEERKLASCPPYRRFVLLRAESPHLEMPLGFLRQVRQIGERRLRERRHAGVMLLDAVPSPMERRAGRYRAQLLVSGRGRAALHSFLSVWVSDIEGLRRARTVRWSVDVDPQEMY